MDKNPSFCMNDIHMPPPLRVLVSHPEPLLAVGLVAALSEQGGFEVSMAASHAESSAQTLRDVVVTDYRGGLALAQGAAHRAQRGSAIMIMTMCYREQDVKAAMAAGVRGYLLHDCSIEELASGVRVLGNGGRYFCMEVAQRIADSLTREPLTRRETDVLRLLALGQCNKSIARQLEITVGTVKTYLNAIFNKLEAGSRTEAVSIATRRGLVGEPMRSQPVMVHSSPARRSGLVRISGSFGRSGLELAHD